MDEAVAQQQVSDVPLGFFLSGGVDSSAVVTAAAAARDESAEPLATFSVGFDTPGGSELPFAAQVAEHVCSDHRPLTLAEEEALEIAEALPVLFDEPFGDTSALPTYLVAERAVEAVRVVLTGDGGDEVFGGYPRYTASVHQRLLSGGESALLAGVKHIAPLRRAVRGIERYWQLGGFAYYTRLLGGLTQGEKTRYRNCWELPADYDDYWSFREHFDTRLPPLQALQLLDFKTYLPDGILTKVDRATMAHSLEARVPLLATPLVDYALGLTDEQRGSNKALFKTAVGPRLPAGIVERQKKGFRRAGARLA